MQTLHDMLKDQPSTRTAGSGAPPATEDLRRRYSKIGISAVAAATQFNGKRDTKTVAVQIAPDRSIARGWSDHR